jgi:hypothetical protein
MIMYEARKPFFYVHPETNMVTNVDPRRCVRIVVNGFKPDIAEIPDLFRWGQTFLKGRGNQAVIDRGVEEWRGLVKEYCLDNFVPLPEQIAFVSNSKHQRRNNFLCVYASSLEAAYVCGRRVQLGSEEALMRWHAVVNRRSKLKMESGISMPSLPIMQKASESAKALTEHTLGFITHHLGLPYYACGDNAGQRVLSKKSIRLKGMPANVNAAEIQDWFEWGASVRPTSVFKDNAAKNRGEAGGAVAMVAEFLAPGLGCYEAEAVVEKAMFINKSLEHPFRGVTVKLQRIRKFSKGEVGLQIGFGVQLHLVEMQGLGSKWAILSFSFFQASMIWRVWSTGRTSPRWKWREFNSRYPLSYTRSFTWQICGELMSQLLKNLIGSRHPTKGLTNIYLMDSAC